MLVTLFCDLTCCFCLKRPRLICLFHFTKRCVSISIYLFSLSRSLTLFCSLSLSRSLSLSLSLPLALSLPLSLSPTLLISLSLYISLYLSLSPIVPLLWHSMDVFILVFLMLLAMIINKAMEFMNKSVQ